MPKAQNNKFIQCCNCKMQIDLAAQALEEVKGCNWCDSREFLLDLNTHQSAYLYFRSPQTNGKRTRKGAYHADESQTLST
jgi:hypothetical protein